MEPRVDIVWGFVVSDFLAAMCSKEVADCRIDSEFFSKDQACFVRPFVDVGEFGAMFLGDAEEFGNSVDPVCVEL